MWLTQSPIGTWVPSLDILTPTPETAQPPAGHSGLTLKGGKVFKALRKLSLHSRKDLADSLQDGSPGDKRTEVVFFLAYSQAFPGHSP